MLDNSERLVKLEMAISQNIQAISSLTKTVDTLAQAMKEEDRDLKASVTELNRSMTECNYKHSSVIDSLTQKQKKLDTLSEIVHQKATKEALRTMDKKTNERIEDIKNFIHKALWWLFGGLIATVSFLLKETVFKQ
jgi:phosphoenolpyruvate-protein kinase (PTS system EI component)